MTTVFLTGGAGFIGSQVARALRTRGDAVVTLDNLNDFYDPAIKRRNLEEFAGDDGFTFVEGDIRDRETVRRIHDEHRPDAVIHLAAMAGVRPSIENPALYADVNVNGLAILLEEATRQGIERFVFASSSSVYGERKDPPFAETDPVDHPISPYAATKKAGELLCHTFHSMTGMGITCLRFFTAYGPRQRPEMAIHKFTRQILGGETIEIYGDGSSGRDYTYIDDIVNGVIRALDRCDGYRIYNLGGSGVTTLSELVSVLGMVIGIEPKVEYLPMQTGDVSLTSASTELSERELGFRPRVGIEEGVRRFVEWYRERYA